MKFHVVLAVGGNDVSWIRNQIAASTEASQNSRSHDWLIGNGCRGYKKAQILVKTRKKKNNDAMMSRIEKITKTVSDKMLVKTSFVDQFLFIKNAKLSVSFNRLIIHAIAMTSFTPESRRDIVTCDWSIHTIVVILKRIRFISTNRAKWQYVR